MARRNYDGTFRNNNKPTKVSDSIQIARWVDTEVLRLKQLGLSYPAIAKRITEVGRGEQRAMTPRPNGIDFPPNYKISVTACRKAFRRALEREPTEAADKLRCLYTQRAEEMILALQPGIQKGDPRAIRAAVCVLEFQAKINGILPAKVLEPCEPPDALSIDLIRRLINNNRTIETVATPPEFAVTTTVAGTEDDQAIEVSSPRSRVSATFSPTRRYTVEEFRRLAE